MVRLLLWSWAQGGDRGIEEGTALCDFGSALRHEPPPILRQHPGVAPGRPHVRLVNVKGPFGQEIAPLGLTHQHKPIWYKSQFSMLRAEVYARNLRTNQNM